MAISRITSNAISGIVSTDKGGTGASTLNNNAVIIGNTTGAVKFVDPGTTGNVLTSNGSAWVSTAASSGVGYAFNKYTAPAPTTPGSFTWTKPAGLVGIRVIVASGGGGGAGGRGSIQFHGGGGGIAEAYIPAPAIPGPVTVTVGGGGAGGAAPSPGPGFSASSGTAGATSSFGAFLSVVGGAGAFAGPTNALSCPGFGGGSVSFDPSVELFYSAWGLPGGVYNPVNPLVVQGSDVMGGGSPAGSAAGWLAQQAVGNTGYFVNGLDANWPRPSPTMNFETISRYLILGPYPSYPPAPAPTVPYAGSMTGGHGAALYGKYANGSNFPSPVPGTHAAPNYVGNPGRANYGISAGGGGGGSIGGTGPAPGGGPPQPGGNGGPGMVIVEEFY